MLTRSILSAALALSSFAATAANYYLVVPVNGRSLAADISVALESAALPEGIVGQPYSYDFTHHLRVSGDSQFDPKVATWTASGVPHGLSLTEGRLSGLPTEASSSAIQVTATYKGKRANQAYPLTVKNRVTVSLQPDGYRTWSNGEIAQSCQAYLNPSAPLTYAGDVGDGLYRVQPAGQSATTVYCDMTRDGGGWTLVARVISGSNSHVNTTAVGALSAPTQPSVAKLSDAYINALMEPSQGLMRLAVDGGRVNFYKLASVPFVAAGVAAVRPVSMALDGPYLMTTANPYHGGLNSYGVGSADMFTVYGPASAADSCRRAIAGNGAISWCGPGGSGTLFVR